MLKETFKNLLVAFIVLLLCGSAQAVVVTIATFADPAVNKNTPLFTVDLVNDLITGGWDDSKTGLTLQIPYSGNIYTNAFFTMTDVNYFGGINGGDTAEGGTIKFFANGQSTSTAPLLRIVFGLGHVTPFSFGAMDMFFIDGVTITGSEITGSLTNETFAFSFSNLSPLNGSWTNGYTATASFTSSAEAPDPATIILLGTAGIWVFTRKKKSA
ncbi:MAG: PEP-CTERM sorting domain-containing protein [Phycisphaerae bacterium]|nr:PEP-CTERM sorting domain-containing protein [Phycisphaerae bacterium]MDD5380656.1 PEP-CTERM sorting domain-containing protein [Phycisphaerae bacterium]